MNTSDNKMKNEIGENMPELNDAQAVAEVQLARNISRLLNEHAQHIDAATTQRLSIARNHAVAQLAAQQTQRVNHYAGNVLHWFEDHVGQYFEQHRVMSGAMVAGVMLLTFFAVQQFEISDNLENSDAFLLASDLPPEAFADKGFDTWLVSKRD